MQDPGGIKVSAHVAPEPSDESLRHLQQMGVTHCYAWVVEEQCNVPFLTGLREKVESFGLTLWNAGCMRWAKNKDHILGTDKREEGIAGFQQMLRDLAASGIRITTFTWEPDGVWSTPKAITRGDVETRAADARLLASETSEPKHGREYTVEELWVNLEIFLKTVRLSPHCLVRKPTAACCSDLLFCQDRLRSMVCALCVGGAGGGRGYDLLRFSLRKRVDLPRQAPDRMHPAEHIELNVGGAG